MPSERSRLCFSGGEQWGVSKGHHPQTANHRNKANPPATITSPLVATDNATHRQLPPPHSITLHEVHYQVSTRGESDAIRGPGSLFQRWRAMGRGRAR
ncbi:MAG: hypothetical protein GY832_18905 [Chloroflexi bacterium]|nr:hypothetical protein [Chloroflexota bacterium]